jgi:hypothetical protein
MRLDFCSAKDGVKGSLPVRSAEEVINRLCTSTRASKVLQGIIDDKTPTKIRLFLVPFNDAMNSQREYRVFCPPMSDRVAAISQYRWFEASYVKDRADATKTAERVFQGAMSIHGRILQHAGKATFAVQEKLRSEGFVFDILDTEAGNIQLVEINPFGAMSGCGSCLFHWIRDAKVMYGIDKDVEVRIAMSELLEGNVWHAETASS